MRCSIGSGGGPDSRDDLLGMAIGLGAPGDRFVGPFDCRLEKGFD